MTDEGVEHARSAHDVDEGVPGGLGEGLPGAGLGGEVEDGVGSGVIEERIPVVLAGDVPDAQLDSGVEGGGAPPLRVDLRMQVVQGDDTVESVGEACGDGAADEACATGDEAGAGHRYFLLPILCVTNRAHDSGSYYNSYSAFDIHRPWFPPLALE